MSNFTYSRRVQFSETDMAGIVHFANFYKYMEEAEHAFFRSLGLTIMHKQADGSIIGWPRVRCSCSFEAPAFFEDLLDIDLTITRCGVKSLTMSFRFHRGDSKIASGELKTVCCLCRPGSPFESIEIPPEYQAVLVEGPSTPRH